MKNKHPKPGYLGPAFHEWLEWLEYIKLGVIKHDFEMTLDEERTT